jgi:hypothetical protein
MRRPFDPELLDDRVCRYMTDLFEDGHSPNVGRYVVYALQHHLCRQASKDFLPCAKKALRGWEKRVPPGIRLPVPEEIVSSLAMELLREGLGHLALMLIIHLDGYFRPSEVISLKRRQVILPIASAGKAYEEALVITLGMSAHQERTKTGQTDDTIHVGTHRPWLRDVFIKYVQSIDGAESRLWDYELDRYECLIRRLVADLGMEALKMTPHCLRHAGASNDAFHGKHRC